MKGEQEQKERRERGWLDVSLDRTQFEGSAALDVKCGGACQPGT